MRQKQDFRRYTSWTRERESLPNGDLFFAGLLAQAG